jgi:Ca-activated chloride channel homolog
MKWFSPFSWSRSYGIRLFINRTHFDIFDPYFGQSIRICTKNQDMVNMAGFFNKIRIILLVCASLLIFSATVPFSAPQKKKQQSAPKAASPNKEEPSEPDNFKISVDVNLVTTDVTVIGNPISELKPEDFILYDNGVAQELTYFSRDQLPLAIALVIDASESIRDYLPMLQLAGYSTLRRLKVDDQVTLFSFNTDLIRLVNLTEDRFLVAEKIDKIKIAFGTNIYDSIFDNVSYLRTKAPQRRRAIILVSDNCHYAMGSDHSPAICSTELLESSTLFYNIRTPGGQADLYCREPDAEIQKMAEETGGEVLNVSTPTGLQPALERIVTGLRKQFTLGFNPSVPGEKGKFHKLSIKFAAENRCPGCRVRSRSGYFSGVALPPPSPDRNKDKKPPVRDAEETDILLIKQSILTAGAFNKDMPGIPFEVNTTQQMNSKGQQEYKVDLLINANAVKFKTVDSKHACKVRAVFFSANEKGKVFDTDWRILEGWMSDESYNRVLQTGISYSATIPAKLQSQMLKVVLYDEESDKIGTKVLMLKQDMKQRSEGRIPALPSIRYFSPSPIPSAWQE